MQSFRGMETVERKITPHTRDMPMLLGHTRVRAYLPVRLASARTALVPPSSLLKNGKPESRRLSHPPGTYSRTNIVKLFVKFSRVNRVNRTFYIPRGAVPPGYYARRLLLAGCCWRIALPCVVKLRSGYHFHLPRIRHAIKHGRRTPSFMQLS